MLLSFPRNKEKVIPALTGMLDDFFDNQFVTFGKVRENQMPIDIYDLKDHLEVVSELPGVRKKDISISVSGNDLVIEGIQKHEKEINRQKFIRNERYKSNYLRKIRLSDDCSTDNIEANYENGLLKIKIPYKTSKPQKEIKIK